MESHAELKIQASGAISSSSRVNPVSSSGYSLTVPASAASEIKKRPLGKKRVPFKNITAHIIADCVIDFCAGHGDLITNLKLQRILYYVQAWYLALHDKNLFNDEFEAWAHGPVQPVVFAKFAPYEHGPLSHAGDRWKIPKAISRHIEDVMEVYGSMSSHELQRRAQHEDPFREARSGLSPDELSTAVISQESMRRFYQAMMSNEQEERKKNNSRG